MSALDDGAVRAAESETSERRLRELAPCEGGSHVHADPRSPYACALLREREQARARLTAADARVAELEAKLAEAESVNSALDSIALADAWDEGFEAGVDPDARDIGAKSNPYRSQP